MPEISIVDTKKIIQAVKNKYKADLSCFSQTPLRYKLDRILKIYELKNTDFLIGKIYSEDAFFQEFLFELFNTNSELFRDPEFWMYMNKTVLHQLNGLFTNFKVLIPASCNSSELISLLILLAENGLRKKSEVYISFTSRYSPFDIFSPETIINVKAIDFENMKKVFPEIDLEKYFTIKSNSLKIDKVLFSKVFDIEQDLDFQLKDHGFNLILFRNILLNFSLTHQNKIVKNLVSGLDKNGLIVFGYRENISSFTNTSDEISALNKKENLFRKEK